MHEKARTVHGTVRRCPEKNDTHHKKRNEKATFAQISVVNKPFLLEISWMRSTISLSRRMSRTTVSVIDDTSTRK